MRALRGVVQGASHAGALAFRTLIPVDENLSNCPLARRVTNSYLSSRLQGGGAFEPVQPRWLPEDSRRKAERRWVRSDGCAATASN